MEPTLQDLIQNQKNHHRLNAEKLTVQTAMQQIAEILDKLEADQQIKVLDIGIYQPSTLTTKYDGYLPALEAVVIGKRNISITIA